MQRDYIIDFIDVFINLSLQPSIFSLEVVLSAASKMLCLSQY